MNNNTAVKIKKTILIVILILACVIGFRYYMQLTSKSFDASSLTTKGPNDFPELIHTNIPGAPKLGAPQLIMGDTIPVRGEGNGWAAPAVYDMDGDGKKDLLIGEFMSGLKMRLNIGSLIRVYLNKGTDEQPKFNDEFVYAPSVSESKESIGSPLSIYTWCCFPFMPRFADLDNDGFTDLLSGQYNPGYISWFRGSENGFLPGVKLEEMYDPIRDKNKDASIAHSLPITDPSGNKYWTYSSADFGDFDNDGDQDMIVGGGPLRICENIGTKSAPKFGKREVLLNVEGAALKPYSKVPYVIDWDQDGILDILSTDGYGSKGSVAVTFFKGLKSLAGSVYQAKGMVGEKDKVQFEDGVSLFTTKNGKKAFPGSWLNLCVTDWNNDGINDLIIGTSVATLNGVFDHELSWSWEKDTGTYKKNPAYLSGSQKERLKKSAKELEALVQKGAELTDAEKKKAGFLSQGIKSRCGNAGYKNRSFAHQGYVYVMLGEKSN